MRFAAEPRHSHGSSERCAVLLVNLGTPYTLGNAALRARFALRSER